MVDEEEELTVLPFRAVLAHLKQNLGVEPLVVRPKIDSRPWREMRGRKLNELQPLLFALDMSTDVHGSALCCLGRCRVSVSVIGPALFANAVQRPVELTGASASSPARQDLGLEVNVRYHERMGGEEVSSILYKAHKTVNEICDEQVEGEQQRQRLPMAILETLQAVVERAHYPNSALYVTASVLVDDCEETVTACALNALALALARAGIRSKGTFGAAVGYIVKKGPTDVCVCLDLTAEERQKLVGEEGATLTTCVLSLLENTRDALYFDVKGTGWQEPWNTRLLRLTCSAAEAVAQQVKQCITTCP